jgi:hypothetical protein
MEGPGVPTTVPVGAVPVPPGPGWVVVPVLVLLLPSGLLAGGARTPAGTERSFTTSSEHGVETAVDSVVEVQRRSERPVSGLGRVWASAEPASRSAASGASKPGKDLFMACSFPTAAAGLKSTRVR